MKNVTPPGRRGRHRFRRRARGRQDLRGQAILRRRSTRKAHAFGSAVVDGYRTREAELRAAVAEAEDAIADLARDDD